MANSTSFGSSSFVLLRYPHRVEKALAQPGALHIFPRQTFPTIQTHRGTTRHHPSPNKSNVMATSPFNRHFSPFPCQKYPVYTRNIDFEQAYTRSPRVAWYGMVWCEISPTLVLLSLGLPICPSPNLEPSVTSPISLRLSSLMLSLRSVPLYTVLPSLQYTGKLPQMLHPAHLWSAAACRYVTIEPMPSPAHPFDFCLELRPAIAYTLIEYTRHARSRFARTHVSNGLQDSACMASWKPSGVHGSATYERCFPLPHPRALIAANGRRDRITKHEQHNGKHDFLSSEISRTTCRNDATEAAISRLDLSVRVAATKRRRNISHSKSRRARFW